MGLHIGLLAVEIKAQVKELSAGGLSHVYSYSVVALQVEGLTCRG